MSLEKYNKIAHSIGEVCMWWSDIEGLIHDIVLHLSWCRDPQHDKERAWETLHIVLLHMNARQRVAAAKSLASEIRSDRSPNFYDRLEALLNYVDGELRIERNRFVHDLWNIDGSSILRQRQVPKVVRPQARERILAMWTEREFANVEEVDAFIANLEMAYQDLVELDNHIAFLLELPGSTKTHEQSLPDEWPSMLDRRWRGSERTVGKPSDE